MILLASSVCMIIGYSTKCNKKVHNAELFKSCESTITVLACVQDPDSRVACETCTKTDMVMVFGEITTKAKVDYEKIVRDTVKEIGFISAEVGLDGTNCKVRGL